MQRLLTKGIGHTKFKKTDFGEIPEDWDIVNLKDISSKFIRNITCKEVEDGFNYTKTSNERQY